MYCLQCRCEFRPGFTHCKSCDVDLVEELSPKDPPEAELDSRWELNRRDSQNIAFVKGAILGMAVAQVVQVALNTAWQHFVSGGPLTGFLSDGLLTTLFHVGLGLTHPLGIVIGGAVGQRRAR